MPNTHSPEEVRDKWIELLAYQSSSPQYVSKFDGRSYAQFQPAHAITFQRLKRQYETLKKLTVIKGGKA